MIWKVLYDFARPNWQSFGHVLFVEAPDLQSAAWESALAVKAKEPGATITRVDVTESSLQARARHEAKVQAMATWQTNVTNGIRNKRHSL